MALPITNIDECWRIAGSLTENRQARFREVLATRLQSIHLILDNVDDPGNRAAVYRSADSFGVVHVHVINERAPRASSRPVSMRAEQWLLLHPYNSISEFFDRNRAAMDETRASVWIADAAPTSVPLSAAFDKVSVPNAETWIVFGNEHSGVSEEWNRVPHKLFWIPMHGFSESLNISVAAAITLFQVCEKRRASLGKPGDLNEQTKLVLLNQWLTQATNAIERSRSSAISKSS